MQSDSIRLSVAITNHPSRRLLAEQIAEKVSADGRSVEIVVDEYLEGVWPNARRCWESYGIDATHHMVLEDDIAVCEDLVEGLEEALTYVPRRCVVSAYNHKRFIKEVRESGSSWAISSWHTAQALILPVNLIEEFLAWVDRYVKPHVMPGDVRLSAFAYYNEIPVYHTVPNLVEHLGHEATTVRSRRPKEHIPGLSYAFIGEDRSAKEVDWSKGIDNPYVEKQTPGRAYYRQFLETDPRKVGC